MRLRTNIAFLILFALVFSMLGTPPFDWPASVPPSARANIATNQQWVPAGPAMDTLAMQLYTDPLSEFDGILGANPQIDLTDTPLTSSNAAQFQQGSNYLATPSPGVNPGFYEIEFNLAQTNFWGCNMSFGNSACGKEIRQGIAHLIDKKQFVSIQLGGSGGALDDPVPNNSGGLPTANPCGWDNSFPQTGSGCQVNAVGGTAYHIAAAIQGDGCGNGYFAPFSWTPGCGTPDFCAAATHFINAGLATGRDSHCVLTGVSSAVTSNPVDFFIRDDNLSLQFLGESIQEGICGVFYGQFSYLNCPPSTIGTQGPFQRTPNLGAIHDFLGFNSLIYQVNQLNLNWGMYTAGTGSEDFAGVTGDGQDQRDPFDTALFFKFNSQFVSGISTIRSPNGPCSTSSTPSNTPPNYVYMCVSNFDTISSQMEFSPCTSAPGDPSSGQINPTFGNCPNTSQLSAKSAGYQAEDQFGQGEFAVPIYYPISTFGYLNNWQGVIASYGGIANFFTYLDSHPPSGASAGTIRQGISNPGISLNPYTAWTATDFLMLGQIYDTLGASNPAVESSLFDWMTIKTDQLPVSQLSYSVPAGTVAAFRLTLRNDIFFHDGRKLTSFDVAFSYLSAMAIGTASATMVVTGITVLSPTQLDLDVSAVGPFTKLYLTAQSILPGRYWSKEVSFKDDEDSCSTAVSRCFNSQYVVTSSGIVCQGGCTVSGKDMTGDPTKVVPTFDPVANRVFVGSGPWMCGSGSSVGGPGCSASNNQNPLPGQQFTFTRFGVGTVPGGCLSGCYFRSSGNLALWAYSGDRGDFNNDFLNFGAVSLCFGKSVGTAGCTVWQHGIGGSAAGTVVGLLQVGIVARFIGVNWVQPYNWIASPPQSIAAFPPVLYEGSVKLNPCSVDPVNGYDC